MEEKSSSSSGKGYRTLSIVLFVVLALFATGAFLYWRELDNTQKEQQAQIDTLNQQIASDKELLTTQLQIAQDQAVEALNAKNAELQQKLDELTKPDDSGNDSTDDSAQ